MEILGRSARQHPLAWLERQALVTSFALYVGTIVLFVAFGLTGCANRPALRTASIALGAAVIAGAVANHHDDPARPNVSTPANPCSATPERCR